MRSMTRGEVRSPTQYGRPVDRRDVLQVDGDDRGGAALHHDLRPAPGRRAEVHDARRVFNNDSVSSIWMSLNAARAR